MSRMLTGGAALSVLLALSPGCRREETPPLEVPPYPSRAPQEEAWRVAPRPAAIAAEPPRNRAKDDLPTAPDPTLLEGVSEGADAAIVRRALADCADVVYETRRVQVLQPREGECVNQFGRRYYTLGNGVIIEVGADLKPKRAAPEPSARPPPEDHQPI